MNWQQPRCMAIQRGTHGASGAQLTERCCDCTLTSTWHCAVLYPRSVALCCVLQAKRQAAQAELEARAAKKRAKRQKKKVGPRVTSPYWASECTAANREERVCRCCSGIVQACMQTQYTDKQVVDFRTICIIPGNVSLIRCAVPRHSVPCHAMLCVV